MGKHSKTLDQIKDLNGGLHWSKVEALFKSYPQRSTRVVGLP